MKQPVFDTIKIYKVIEYPFFNGYNLEGSWEVYRISFFFCSPEKNKEIYEWCKTHLHGWWTFHKVRWNSDDDMWTAPRIDINSDDDLMLLKLRFS